MVSIRRSGMASVAVRVDAVPVRLDAVTSVAGLRVALVEAVLASWRLAGSVGPAGDASARGGWASDGPWGQMLRAAVHGDYDARGGDGGGGGIDELPAPALPSTEADLALIARAEGWALLLAARPGWTRGRSARVSDGAIVAAVARQMAAGAGVGARVDWGRVARALGFAVGDADAVADVLRARHGRALAWLWVRVVERGGVGGVRAAGVIIDDPLARL